MANSIEQTEVSRIFGLDESQGDSESDCVFEFIEPDLDEDDAKEVEALSSQSNTSTLPANTKEWTNAQQTQWFVENEKLLYYLVNRYKGAIPDAAMISPDDLYQISCISALKAMDAFDSSRNTKFSTYAAKVIKTEILMLSRKYYAGKRNGIVHSLDAPNPQQGKDKGEQLGYDNLDHSISDGLHQTQESIEDMYAYKELAAYIQHIHDTRFTDQEKVIYRALTQQITQDQAAKELDCSQAKVSQKVKMLRGKILYSLRQAGFIEL